MTYTGPFKDIYRRRQQQFGPRLWACVREHANWMISAQERGIAPAAEITPALLTRFSLKELDENRVKQAIGNMIWQIMREHGYVRNRRKSLPLKSRGVFKSAMTYILRSPQHPS